MTNDVTSTTTVGIAPDPSVLAPVTIVAEGVASATTITRSRVRGHEIVTDEPPIRGGQDLGAAPTETFVAALAGVTTVILHRLAKRDGLRLDVADVRVEATLDRRGVWLAEAVPLPWPVVLTTATIETEANEETLRVWESDLAAFSPLHALLRSGGTAVRVRLARVATGRE